MLAGWIGAVVSALTTTGPLSLLIAGCGAFNGLVALSAAELASKRPARL
jgi:hypothetical protein